MSATRGGASDLGSNSPEGTTRTSRRRDHLVDRGHDHVEEDDELLVVLGADLEAANLGQALERDVAELGHLEELGRGARSRSARIEGQRE